MVHLLHTPWVLWYHSIDDTNWTKDTYTKVAEIETVEDFLGVFRKFETFCACLLHFRKNLKSGPRVCHITCSASVANSPPLTARQAHASFPQRSCMPRPPRRTQPPAATTTTRWRRSNASAAWACQRIARRVPGCRRRGWRPAPTTTSRTTSSLASAARSLRRSSRHVPGWLR